MAKHELSFEATLQREGPSRTGIGRELTAQLLARHPELDCIYFSNDDMAAGGAFHCIASGLALPEKLLLAGFAQVRQNPLKFA